MIKLKKNDIHKMSKYDLVRRIIMGLFDSIVKGASFYLNEQKNTLERQIRNMSDDQVIHNYNKFVNQGCEDFRIELLENEMRRRKLY